jgi:hypothetical protein
LACKRIFNLFAKFATDFGNVNVMTGSRLLAELNTKPLVKALTVLKAFKNQLTLAQSTNSPIPIIAAAVSKNYPPGARAPIQMWVPRLQLPFLPLPFQITPTRINAVM